MSEEKQPPIEPISGTIVPRYAGPSTFCRLPELRDVPYCDVAMLGIPFDSGTSYRSGARFGPQAIRQASRHLRTNFHPAYDTEPFKQLQVADAGDVACNPYNIEEAITQIEVAATDLFTKAKSIVSLGGDHTITWPDVTGVARARGWGKVSVIHFDAHADTGDIEFGSLVGHGQPMRRLIESGAARGDKFFQIGLRGYWPPPDILEWMTEQKMRSYEMTEIVARGFDVVMDEVIDASMDECDGVFLSVDIDVVDPGSAPGTGTPEPGGLTARQLLDAVRDIAYRVPLLGIDVVEVSPPYDHADITALLGNRVVLEALSGMAKRKSGEPWDKSQPLLDGRS